MANPTSRWNASDYASCGAFVPALGAPILESLSPSRGERILDVGCGDGVLTSQIAASGASVTGVDNSPELLAAARDRGVDARWADAAELDFDAEFDAVFSNAALHWVLDYRAAAAVMFRALRPGGRLAVEFGGFGNIAAIRTAILAVLRQRGLVADERDSSGPPGATPVMPADQFYPTAEQYLQVLRDAGFDDVRAELVPRPTPLPAGLLAWLATFRGGLMDVLGIRGELRREVFDQVSELLEPALRTSEGMWWADYVRIRAWGRRP